MKGREDDNSVRHRDVIGERVRTLLEVRWAGNQCEMVCAVRFSQGLISKVVNGQQAPGRRFLAALASQASVNADWLYRGEGTPLALPEKGTLPIAQAILPGDPRDHAQLVTGRRHPVAEAFDRSTRYWLEVQTGSPALRESSYCMMVGDLLLIETDPPYLQRLDLLEGRLLGVRVPRDPHNPTFELAVLELTTDDINLRVFEQIIRERETPSSPPSNTPRKVRATKGSTAAQSPPPRARTKKGRETPDRRRGTSHGETDRRKCWKYYAVCP